MSRIVEWLEGASDCFGGPCRGRTYGPLIKSVNKPIFEKFAVATVSPLS